MPKAPRRRKLLPFAASLMNEDTWHTTIRCQAEEIEALRLLCSRAADALSFWSTVEGHDTPRTNELITELRKAAE